MRPAGPWDLYGMDLLSWRAIHRNERIPLTAACFLGGRYLRKGERAESPFDLPAGLGWDPPTGDNTVCSPFTECVLAGAYPELPWSFEDHKDMQVWEGRGKDAPMNVLARLGLGERVDEMIEGEWHLVQGWRKSGGGHALLVRPLGERHLVLNATSAGLRGPDMVLRPTGWLASQYDAELHLGAITKP